MSRWWPLIAVLAAVVLTAAMSEAEARGRCDAHLRGAKHKTSRLLVFTRPIASSEEGGRRFYACRRAGGRAIRIGEDLPSDGIYGSDSTVERLRVAGDHVSVLMTEGAASASACTKYSGDPCPSTRTFLRVIDTRARTRMDLPTSGIVNAVALAGAGAIAWRERGDVLYASDLRSPAREVDRGRVTAVRFDGHTLSWTRDGEPRSLRLGR